MEIFFVALISKWNKGRGFTLYDNPVAPGITAYSRTILHCNIALTEMCRLAIVWLALWNAL
jgi:hypothetical protein